jgi:Tol biopolymer transport system component
MLLPSPPRRFIGGMVLMLAGCTAGEADATAEVFATAPAPPTPSSSSAAPPQASADAELEATVFGDGVISTDDEEYRISFSPDGQTAWFARGSGFFPETRQATIMESSLIEGEWSEPAVASFSGTYPDIDPWVSPDGTSIYFSSIRPVGGEDRADADVWRVDRSDDGWGEPVHLPAISSEADELGASVSSDGTLWFASDRPGGAGGWDLYTAQPTNGDFATPEPVTELNSPIWEFNPAISADGSELIFTSIGRDGGSGLGDLYIVQRSNGTWADESPIGINTAADEYHGSLSPDGEVLYFARRVGHGDLYAVAWRAGD